MESESTDFLKSVYLFHDLDEDQLLWLAENMQKKVFIVGDEIFAQGDKAESFYIIKSGSVSVEKWATDDEQHITTIGAGTILGEMAFLEGGERSASAKAHENVELLIIPFDLLEEKINSDRDFGFHFYRNIAHCLNKRIEKTTNDFSSLKELKLKHH